MRVLDMAVDERRRAAGLLAGLSAEQLRQPSLCAAWTVHDVGAHLISYLHFGRTKLYLGMLRTGADIDRVNMSLTRREARRPSAEIVELLHRRATCPIEMPGSGHDSALTDVILHDLDIRVPLGIPRTTAEERLRRAFVHLTTTPALGFGFGLRSRLDGLRVVATDTGWAQGTGAPVRGQVEALLLAITGRPTDLTALDGDGVPILQQRLANQWRPGAGQRLATALGVLVKAPSRATAAPGTGR